MSNIYFIVGKSSTGKDTIFAHLMDNEMLRLRKVVSYTTRPMRESEEDGREYYFVSEDKMKEMEKDGVVIERRTYHTINGDWHYFLADDGQIKLGKHNYLVIGTLESYRQVRDYFGAEHVCPIYIEVDDGIRLQRAINREHQQKEPNFDEVCRRYLADQADFSEEAIKAAGITKRYVNDSLVDCLKEIEKDISDGNSR
ncbi:MAG: guanylate kinase [Lachnospiraceae bacterium]|nr:guanylate kinase [Lachnospiraceae bacterium]